MALTGVLALLSCSFRVCREGEGSSVLCDTFFLRVGDDSLDPSAEELPLAAVLVSVRALDLLLPGGLGLLTLPGLGVLFSMVTVVDRGCAPPSLALPTHDL